jgi:hypothetical protein
MSSQTTEVCSAALNPSNQVASLLSDIPLFSVGLMAFGTFTFLAAMRRMSLTVSFLFVSSFVTFGAGILDLSGALAETSGSGATHTVRVLQIIRDVALAIGTCLVYLFMWLFVAECPQVEVQGNLPHLQAPHQHSGSWSRWGLLGSAKLLSLSFSLLIPILRILWHQSMPLTLRRPLLITDAIIEIALSATFILKLLLNALQVSSDTRRKAMRDYVAPIAAMVISAVLAGGNLLTISQVTSGQAFTDTILGRFILAIELYILLLFALMNAFYQELKVSACAGDRPQPAPSARSVPSIWIGPQRASWLHRDSMPRVRSQGIRQAVDHESQAAAESQKAPSSKRQISPPRSNNPSKPSQNSSRDRVTSYQSYATSTNSGPNPSLATIDRIFHHKSNLDKILSRIRILSLQRDDARVTSPSPLVPASVQEASALEQPKEEKSSRWCSKISASELSPPSTNVQEPLSPIVATASTQTLTFPGIRARRSACSREVAAIALEDALNDFLIIPRGVIDRHDSAATQYDVTSFIDGMTTPKNDSPTIPQANYAILLATASAGSQEISHMGLPVSPLESPYPFPSTPRDSDSQVGETQTGFTPRPLLLGTSTSPPPSFPGRTAREFVPFGPVKRMVAGSRKTLSESNIQLP